MSRFIGKTVWIISTNDVRYQGCLEDVSAAQGTIQLSQAKNFGTEGRRNGVDEIAPQSDIIPSIVFSRTDVKSMELLENTPEFQEPVAAPPAAATAAQPKEQSSSSQFEAVQPQQEAQAPVQQQRQQRQPRDNTRTKRRPRNEPRLPPSVPALGNNDDVAENGEDEDTFMFSSAQQVAIAENERSQTEGEEQEKPKYDKASSFFDNLSGGSEFRSTKREQSLNYETFGSAASSYHANRGNSNGHSGRGGRGGRNNGDLGYKSRARPPREHEGADDVFERQREARARGGRGRNNNRTQNEWTTVNSSSTDSPKTSNGLPDFSSLDQQPVRRSRGRGNNSNNAGTSSNTRTNVNRFQPLE